LQLFCAREQRWADRRRAERATDRTHRFAHGVNEREAGVLHQMPSIGDLHRGGLRRDNQDENPATIRMRMRRRGGDEGRA
jgi:hypothetical protein